MPDVVRDTLTAALRPYREAFPSARWLDPATWHVTLLFLGDIPASAVPRLGAACDHVGATWPAFDVDVEGGGGRVARGDRVAWLWIRRHARTVIELADDLERAVVSGAPDVPSPRRAKSAHLTVARRADGALVDAMRDEARGPLTAGWRADRIRLMRSFLDPQGARYEVVHESPLRSEGG